MAETPWGWVPDQLLGFAPSTVTNPIQTGAMPPQYILDAMGGSFDQSRYYWNPEAMALVDRYTGGTYGYGHIPDPSLGTDVVTNLSGYNANGQTDPGTFHFGEGINPFIAFPGESYNAGLVPNSGLFLSSDPNEIAEYGSSARDRNWQGIARVGTVVGGGAALGATGSGPLFGGGAGAGGSGAVGGYTGGGGSGVLSTSIPGDLGAFISEGAAAQGAASGAGGGWAGLLSGARNWAPLIGGILGAVDANNQPDSISSIYAPAPELTAAGQDVLGSLGSQFTAGYTPAPMNPATTAAIERLGGFGGNAINPYLDTVFNAAANATQSRLASEFARSGRNVGGVDHAGFRSDELQNLAAGIYGPGYEAERNRELASVGPLLAAGEYARGVEQEGLDAPYINALRYLGGLNSLLPLFPGTNTQPLFNNPWAGFLGGAQLGSLFRG